MSKFAILVVAGAAVFLLTRRSVAQPLGSGATPWLPVPPEPEPVVREVTVEDRRYRVTRFNSGIYQVELLGTAGQSQASITFGQQGAPVRLGDDELIDNYILKDVHQFPTDLFKQGLVV